jgi:hypothetical protein
MPGFSARLGRGLISAVILVVLGVQAIAALALTPGPIEKPPFLWPFLNYPMYSAPHYEGEGIPRFRVMVMTADGREIEVTKENLGTDFWIFRNAFLQPFENEGMRDELEPGVELFERRHGVTVVEVRLEDRPLLLTREGTADGPTEVRGVARRESPGGSWEWEMAP